MRPASAAFSTPTRIDPASTAGSEGNWPPRSGTDYGAPAGGTATGVPQEEPLAGLPPLSPRVSRDASRKGGPMNRPGTGGPCGRKLQIHLRPGPPAGPGQYVPFRRSDKNPNLTSIGRDVRHRPGRTDDEHAQPASHFCRCLPDLRRPDGNSGISQVKKHALRGVLDQP